MRLLNTKSIELELLHALPPRYAIVSHRWGDESEEVLFTDIGDPERAQEKKSGYYKVQGSCAQALQDGINYVWLDTCCIDKSNSTELTEAINSMYNWYRGSAVCYVYLYDICDPDPSKFIKSDWFSRGWTLQELIAPQTLKFFTRDWRFIGTREELMDLIVQRTGISPDILRSGKVPSKTTISQKMVWSAERETTKVEDKSYSMLGILGVSMYPIYGIGSSAFEDLQHRLISKCSDQTLFSWYHTCTEPEDVVVEGADSTHNPVESGAASAPVPAPAPNLSPTLTPSLAHTPSSHMAANINAESGEANVKDPPLNTTGLLAPTPSHYIKSYEIPERDFCKYYVDNIRDYGYRSQFSITNNLIRINLPMKHMVGRVWKAVLRCSLDPPDGNQVQRPLVIYLREVEPHWKFARVHLAPEEGREIEKDVHGVPGSLERLPDAEVYLHGYMVRNVDVVALLGENVENEPSRQPQGDPHVLPEPTDAERIAHLPRHPPGIKTLNILVCGEPGVAAGRVVNFILGHTLFKPLIDYAHEPMATTVVDATVASRHIRIIHVVGPQDPFIEPKVYHATLRHIHLFVQLIRDAGGIHLMLMCMVGTQLTVSVKNNYRLFYEYVCRRQVPMFLVVSGLGGALRMEDWWESHTRDLEFQPVAQCVFAHACITVLQGDDDEQGRKYQESRELVQGFVWRFMDNLKTATRTYCPEDITEWFASVAKSSMDFLLLGQRSTLEPEAVKKTLADGTDLSGSEITDIVRRLFDGEMEL